MPKLQSLALSACEVSLDPAPLASLHELRRLDLEGVRRLPHFEVFSRMEDLQTLRISNCGVDSFSKVDRLKGLTTLTFFHCELPPIDFLPSLPRLVYLTLNESRCRKIGPVGEQSRLSHVKISDGNLKSVSMLAACNSLRSLDLATYGEHSAIQQFVDCLGEQRRSSLATLILPCSGDVFDISSLHVLKYLRSLSLCVTGSAPAMLQGLRQLKMLEMIGQREADTFPEIDHLDNLIVLSCSMEELDSNELRQVGHLQNLRCLQLTGCTSLPGNMHIGQLTNLESLSISHSSVRGLKFVRKLKNLRSLSFDECDLPPDVGILAEAMAAGVAVELDDWELLDKIKARAAQLGKSSE